MTKRYTENFNTVQLQSYTDAQIAFIASVEHDYRHNSLADLVADYAEELDRLAGPVAGDVLETADGRGKLLVQYTAVSADGVTVYGRWIAEDGSIEALAAVPLQDLTEEEQ